MHSNERLPVIEDRFAPWLDDAKWVNFGGGHHITKPDYDVGLLIDLIRDFKRQHRVEVFLEPGEAIALNAGVLVASVLDLIDNDGAIAILDTSATAHMPDVLEMPYRPQIRGRRRTAKACPHLPTRRPELFGGRRDRGVLLCPAPEGRETGWSSKTWPTTRW